MGKGSRSGSALPERSEVLCRSCADPSQQLSHTRHNGNMKRTRNTRPAPTHRMATVDRWSIRAVIVLQGLALILGILAGTSLENSTAVLEGFLKLLEIVTRAS